MTEQEQKNKERLLSKGQLYEQPFESTVPMIGPLIVTFRSIWNSVAAKWYMRPLIQQQSEFNAAVVQQMDDFENQLYEQVVEQDREQTHLMRETAELSINLVHLNRLLQSLDERLAHLEASNGTQEEE